MQQYGNLKNDARDFMLLAVSAHAGVKSDMLLATLRGNNVVEMVETLMNSQQNKSPKGCFSILTLLSDFDFTDF